MNHIFQDLSIHELEKLVAALKTGRLTSPFGELSLRVYCNSKIVSNLYQEFTRLFHEGWTTTQIAFCLEGIQHTKERSLKEAQQVELVWTGPESKGLLDRDTGVVVRELFGTAESEVLVVGFAVYQGHQVFQRLAERMEEIPSLQVRLFLDVRREYRDDTHESDIIKKFANDFRVKQWPSKKLPEIYFDPRSLSDNKEKQSKLHAKCIVIDRKISLVTSANFTEAAQTRNIEVGTLVQSAAFAEDLTYHFERLLEEQLLVQLPDVG